MRKKHNDGLLKLIHTLPQDIVMAEVGCYAGASTLLFMKSGKVNMLYAIDPWRGGYDDQDPASQSDMVAVESMFDMSLMGYNVTKLKMSLHEAMSHLPPLDFIYIDGDHRYESVLKDIELSIKIVKTNGIIAGHDYRRSNPIVRAVHDVFGKPDVLFPDSSWLVHNKQGVI